MTLPMTLRNFTATIDGVGYAGRIREGRAPTIGVITESFQAAGLAAPIEVDMGMVQPMECELTFVEFSHELIGQLARPDLTWVLRGVEADNQTTRAIVYRMRGTARVVDPGTWSRERLASLSLRLNVHYVQLEIDGQEYLEIDALNMIRRVAGVDQLAEQRRLLGLT